MASPVVPVSVNIEHYYILGPRDPRAPVRWGKYVGKCDVVGSVLGQGQIGEQRRTGHNYMGNLSICLKS